MEKRPTGYVSLNFIQAIRDLGTPLPREGQLPAQFPRFEVKRHSL